MVIIVNNPPLQLHTQLGNFFNTALVGRGFGDLHFELADVAGIGVDAQQLRGLALEEVGGKGVVGERLGDAVGRAPAAGGKVHADGAGVVGIEGFAAERACRGEARRGFLDDSLAAGRAEDMAYEINSIKLRFC